MEKRSFKTKRRAKPNLIPPYKSIEPIRILFFFNQHTLALFREAVGTRAVLFGMRVLSKRDRIRNYIYIIRFLGIALLARLQNKNLEVYIPHTRRIMKLIYWITKKENLIMIDDGAIFLHREALSEISGSNISRCVTSSGFFWPDGVFQEVISVPRAAVYSEIVRRWEPELLPSSHSGVYFIDNGRLPYDRQLEINGLVSANCEQPVICLWHPSRRTQVPLISGYATPAEAVINKSPRNTMIFGYDSTTMFNLSAAGFTHIYRLVGQAPTPISDEVFDSFGIKSIELKI